MILVTGGTGFLGRFIVDELRQRGEEVRILARNPAKARAIFGAETVDIAEGDLLDQLAVEKALAGVDKVVHTAAVVSFWKRRRPEMRQVNVDGTELLANLCLDRGIQQFVHVSSVAALGRTGNPGVIDESAKWSKSKLNTYYGRTKFLAELRVLRAVQEGLPAVMVNPGVIIGPGDWQAGPPKIFQTIYKGLKYYNPGTVGVVAAVDVARAIAGLLDSGLHAGERHVLVSDSLPYRQFFGWVAEGLGTQAPQRIPPAWLMRLTARLLQFLGNLRNREPLITPETARISRAHSEYDGSKITQVIDFQYSDIREAILATGQQFLQEHGRDA
ncbi:MAG: NAD-dependent epimerase/dehydratase family protein [Bacteroidota bacterium]